MRRQVWFHFLSTLTSFFFPVCRRSQKINKNRTGRQGNTSGAQRLQGSTKISGICRAFAIARKNGAKTENPLIFGKIGRPTHQYPSVLRSADFSEIGVFPGFCGLFCALANTLQTAGKSGVSGPKTQEKGSPRDGLKPRRRRPSPSACRAPGLQAKK